MHETILYQLVFGVAVVVDSLENTTPLGGGHHEMMSVPTVVLRRSVVAAVTNVAVSVPVTVQLLRADVVS
jgi:hypothetical protein